MTCEGLRAKWRLCEAWQGTKHLVGLIWGAAGSGQRDTCGRAWQRAKGRVGPLWNKKRGWRHSGTCVGCEDGLRAQWDPCGAQGGVGKMNSVWSAVKIEHILSQWG